MENRNITVLKWSVGILVVLNIILLVNFWKSNGLTAHPRFPKMAGGHGPAEMIINELKLSKEQIVQFDKLKEAHHSSMLELQAKGNELRNNYFNNLKQDNPDQKVIDELANAIGDNQKQIETITFNHFMDVRKLCNEEQKKRFDLIINDVLQHMTGGRRGGDMPPPHGEGPPPHHEEHP